MNSPNPILNQFITEYRTVDEVNDYLLQYINDVLNGNNTQEILIADSQVTVQISFSNSDFQDPNYSAGDSPVLSIPTSDFQQIAQAWMNFLNNN